MHFTICTTMTSLLPVCRLTKIQRVHAPKVNPYADKTQRVVYFMTNANRYDYVEVTRENNSSLKK